MLTIAIAMLKVKVSTISIIRKKVSATLSTPLTPHS